MNDIDPISLEALRWLQYSYRDLSVAQRLTMCAPSHACWLCQQAAEKALKAALLSERIGFPRTHDLDILRNMLPASWAVHDTHNNLSKLTEWAVEARYPGDWLEPTHANAVWAESEAHSLYDSVAAEFERRGICSSKGDE